MTSTHISLFLVLTCSALLISANKALNIRGRSIEVPVAAPAAAAVPEANVPQIINEPNSLNTVSAKKEVIPAMVPVNPEMSFQAAIVESSKPEMSIQNNDISNVKLEDDTKNNINIFKNAPGTPAVTPADMNLLNVLNALDDLKYKLDLFKEDIMQLTLPIGLAAQMTLLKPEGEVMPEPDESKVTVQATPQQPEVQKNVNSPVNQDAVIEEPTGVPSREARSRPYGGYGYAHGHGGHTGYAYGHGGHTGYIG